jgi:outer membrane protein
MFRQIGSHILLTLVFAVVATPPAHADNTRVAFVNVAKVLEQAPLAIAANKRLEKEFAPRNDALVALRKELRDLEERAAREGVTMSESQLRKLELDIRTRKREIKRSQDDYAEDLNIRRNEELRKLQKKVYDAIVALAKKEKYDMVLGDGVIYAGDSVDITDQVLKMLSAEYKSAPSN